MYGLEFMSLIDAHFGESTHLTMHPDHIDSILQELSLSNFGHLVAPLALFVNLATRCLPWIALLASSLNSFRVSDIRRAH